MPELISALQKRWPTLAEMHPSPLFPLHRSSPAAKCMASSPIAAVRLPTAPTADSDFGKEQACPPMDSLLSFLFEEGSSGLGGSPTSALQQENVSSEATSPTSSADSEIALGQSSPCACSQAPSFSSEQASTLVSVDPTNCNMRYTRAEISQPRFAYEWLSDDKHIMCERWADLRTALEVCAEEAATLPREERIRSPEEWHKEIADLDTWLLRSELVQGVVMCTSHWPMENARSQNIIRGYYGLSQHYEEDTVASWAASKDALMQAFYDDLFDAEFKAPEGVHRIVVASEVTADDDAGSEDCCSDNESEGEYDADTESEAGLLSDPKATVTVAAKVESQAVGGNTVALAEQEEEVDTASDEVPEMPGARRSWWKKASCGIGQACMGAAKAVAGVLSSAYSFILKPLTTSWCSDWVGRSML